MLQVVPKPKNVFKSIHVPELYISQTFSRYVLADCDLDPILIALQLEIE